MGVLSNIVDQIGSIDLLAGAAPKAKGPVQDVIAAATGAPSSASSRGKGHNKAVISSFGEKEGKAADGGENKDHGGKDHAGKGADEHEEEAAGGGEGEDGAK
ncbi:unnamed protein product [Amoebophrya sp. A25]|nr:unnamed protein product [Amoebophrya sp. A25]|eukprot:GSA25T00022335001.1